MIFHPEIKLASYNHDYKEHSDHLFFQYIPNKYNYQEPFFAQKTNVFCWRSHTVPIWIHLTLFKFLWLSTKCKSENLPVKVSVHKQSNSVTIYNQWRNLQLIYPVCTSSGWWRDNLSTSGCHDSPGARGILSNDAPNNDFTIVFKPSIHCDKGK